MRTRLGSALIIYIGVYCQKAIYLYIAFHKDLFRLRDSNLFYHLKVF